MRTSRALALILLGGLLTACGQPTDTPGASTSVGTSPGASAGSTSVGGLHLTVRPSVGVQEFPSEEPGKPKQQGVVVEYTLRNDGTRPVRVHDLIPAGLGSATLPQDVNPEHAWVFMDGGRIRLSKQGFDTALGVTFLAAPVVGAHVLEAGKTLDGRAYAALPLDLDVPSPEFTAPRTPLDPQARVAQFCLQVSTGTEGRPWSADPKVLEVPTGEPAEGGLICSEPWALPAD
jgi:hypothetical protein